MIETPQGAGPGKSPSSSSLPERVELVALAVKERGIRCLRLDTKEAVTFKPNLQPDEEVPGEILTVKPGKLWSYAGTRYLSGELISSRIEIEKLGLTPLKLEDHGFWDPTDEDWGDPGRSQDYFKPVRKAGRRPWYEMEQVIPGDDPKEPCPVHRASELHGCGDEESAFKIMERLLTTDLRCVDAHAHLGAWDFNHEPGSEWTLKRAMRHYEVGVRIAELSLEAGFNGVLKWGMIDNRPYLRCLHGYGLCHWRLGDATRARPIFDRMLWLNSTDNQGVCFLLMAIDDGQSWEAFKEDQEQLPHVQARLARRAVN